MLELEAEELEVAQQLEELELQEHLLDLEEVVEEGLRQQVVGLRQPWQLERRRLHQL